MGKGPVVAESDMSRKVDGIFSGGGGHCIPFRALDLNPIFFRHME